MKKERILFFALAATVPLIAQPIVRVDSLFAPSLGRTKIYSIILPSNSPQSNRTPTLFLLHGYGGDHSDWSLRTRLANYVGDAPIIVVMPDAENSWYVNSETEPRRRFEDYIVTDLRTHVFRRYPIDTTRVAIAGLSMGGYGALLLAVRHPRVFRFAGSLSGPLSVPGDLEEWGRFPWGQKIAPSLRAAFGTSKSAAEKYDLVSLLRNSDRASLPFIYIAMGTKDGFPTFLAANRLLTDSLRAFGITYEYHETPGGHNWQYWDQEIQPLVRRMMELWK